MPFQLIRNDITQIEADAIVNAANSHLAPGGGVCGAIFNAAGREKLEEACKKIGYCATGEAVITPGFDSKAKYIIHTVGPVYGEEPQLQEKQLYDCYFKSLTIAGQKRISSIAFPLISSGIYGYPKCEALDIAISAIRNFLEHSEMMVYLAVYDDDSYRESKKRVSNIAEYITENRIRRELYRDRMREESARSLPPMMPCATSVGMAHTSPSVQEKKLCNSEPAVSYSKKIIDEDIALESKTECKESFSNSFIKKLLERKSETFSQMLLRLIDQKHMTDVEVYKRANIDRKLFSKIRKKEYVPKKQTAIALAIALRLNYDETIDLLARAGYAFSVSSDFDIIIAYFIKNGIYDIYEINVALFDFEQPLLGA